MTAPTIIRLTLRNKILMAIVGLIAGLTVASLFVINRQVSSQIEAQAESEFEAVRDAFKNFLHLRGQQLVESSLLISKYPSFVDPVVRKDEQNVRLAIIDMMSSLRADLLVVTDEKGTVLGRFNSPLTGDNISHRPSVEGALAGIDSDSVDAWTEQGRIYTVATSYILMPGRNYIAGTISLGQELLDFDAQDLARSTRTEISFIYNNNVIASSKDELFRNDLLKAYVNNKGMIDESVRKWNPYSGESTLDGEPYYITYGPVVPDRPGMYVISIPLKAQLEELADIQSQIYIVGAAGIFVAIILGIFISNGITSPVAQLMKATEEVRNGSYDLQLNVTSNDELGALASSFSSMVAGLRQRDFMQKFVSSSTVEMINRAKAGNLALGGERTILTILFSDIRGFTAYSERKPPEEVIELLNAYLSVQTKIIVAHEGVVDKFVGDEIVALFRGEDMVDRAVESAFQIQREIINLKKRFTEQIDVGIGINSGMVVLGNVGSEERMDHTVLGSNVNLASRLCSKAEPGQILMSESSFRLLKLKLQTRTLDAIHVKGVTQPVQVFDIVYDREAGAPALEEKKAL